MNVITKCPTCGWEAHYKEESPEWVQQKIDEGWAWCGEGHDKVALVIVTPAAGTRDER